MIDFQAEPISITGALPSLLRIQSKSTNPPTLNPCCSKSFCARILRRHMLISR